MKSETSTRLKQLTHRAMTAVIAVIAAATLAVGAAFGTSVSFDSLTVASVVLMTSFQSGCVTLTTTDAEVGGDGRHAVSVAGPLRRILAGVVPLTACLAGGLLSGFAIQQLVIPAVLLSSAAFCVACHAVQFGSSRSPTAIVAVIGTAAEIAWFRSWTRPLQNGRVRHAFLVLPQDDQPAESVLGQLALLIRGNAVRQAILIQTQSGRHRAEFQSRIERACCAAGLRLTLFSATERDGNSIVPAVAVNSEALLVASGSDLASAASQLLKRQIDIVLSLPVVVFVLPLLCVIVKLIHLRESPGPLLYRQLRAGRNGVPFTILKFRSMHVAGEAGGGCDSARVFAAGRILRASRIDEFPQFLNVLLGSMSLVGPRPHHIDDTERFRDVARHYPLRSVVKPGITGQAQFREFRGDVAKNCVRSRLAEDLSYIGSWNVLVDVRLILNSFRVIVHGLLSPFLRKPEDDSVPDIIPMRPPAAEPAATSRHDQSRITSRRAA